MEPAASGVIPPDARPPVGGDATPHPGAVGSRPLVRPAIVPVAGGFSPDHPYVRRFWTAVLGPAAVADLLRLTTAARRGEELRRPLHLPSLAREGMVGWQAGRLRVRSTVPALSRRHLRRLPVSLRTEHDRWLEELPRSLAP